VKFHYFHLMPWPYLPDDFRQKYPSVWIDAPASELYDGVRGHDVYNDYLDELEFAEEMGFDSIGVNEHHSNAYGLMPSPNLMAAALARRTSRANILVMGNSVALYNPPTRVAEEMAMLDVLSGGRLIAGFPLGTSMDTVYAYSQNPATLRAKYDEGVELILKAWAAEEPFAWNGKFNKLRYVSVWPRPIQQPHPPVWIPGGGAIEVWDYCIQNDFCYAYLSFFGLERAKPTMQGFWEAVDRLGAEPNPYRTAFVQYVAIADSDAEAERLYAEHAEYFYNKCLHIDSRYMAPPGYQTIPSLRRGLQRAFRARPAAASSAAGVTWKEIADNGWIIAGSPETVAERIEAVADTLNVGHLITQPIFGSMPRDVAFHNTRRFAEEVIPRLRPKFSEWEDRWTPRTPSAKSAARPVPAVDGVGAAAVPAAVASSAAVTDWAVAEQVGR
jgi:alkanesulfonate monooxygenase SsuD/methylene tetrahydromethanopterin reductase-like flavin-dependent oxidoreductase (luciferase family)